MRVKLGPHVATKVPSLAKATNLIGAPCCKAMFCTPFALCQSAALLPWTVRKASEHGLNVITRAPAMLGTMDKKSAAVFLTGMPFEGSAKNRGICVPKTTELMVLIWAWAADADRAREKERANIFFMGTRFPGKGVR